MAITITTTRWGTAYVTFPYDARAVEIIKTVPGRKWAAAEKRWSIDTLDIEVAARRFYEAGFGVGVDGVSWSPPAPRQLAGERPLTAFVHSLPRHLRQPVYKALAKALHPDVGGDLALMQELNNTDHK